MKYYRLAFLISFTLLMFSFSGGLSWAQDIVNNEADINYYEDNENLDIEEDTVKVNDSFESYNRFMFKFNDKVYSYALNPISTVYGLFFPKPIQKSVNNFFSNISMPIRFFNNVFQTKFESASTELGRFLINSTIGLGGLFDPAESTFNLEQHTEDFGQTLGYYGMGSGSYIVWPILGSSNCRDSIGYIVDAAFNPLTWLSIEHVEPDEVFTGLHGLNYTNNYSYNVRDNYENIIEGAIDPYISIRHAYTQNRKKKIEE